MCRIILTPKSWLLLVCTLLALRTSAQVTLPTSRMIFQRGQDNQAFIPIQGQCPAGTVRIEATAAVINGGGSVGWTSVVEPVTGTGFSGRLRLQGGWYGLTVRAVGSGGVLATWTVDRVGVGEVFIVSGHSVASGDNNRPIVASTEDRVNAIARPADQAVRYTYELSPTVANLPRQWAQYGEIIPAPFGELPYFWSKCAERLVQRLNVPVAMYQTAFGGTNLEMWWKSSQGIQFPHSFVRSNLGMPYINLKHALTIYSAQSGVRALMCDHGANDLANPDGNQIAGYYKGMLDQARADFGFPVWALINRATPGINENNPFRAVRQAQDAATAYTNCAPGPDYDTQMAPEDRYDNIHFALSGMNKAAVVWADAVTDSFLQRATPFQPAWPNGVTTTTPAPTPVEVPPTPTPTPVVVTPTPTTNLATAPASYQGHLDVAHCDAIGGWAANISNPGQPLSVDIYIDGQKATTVLAENERRDVAAAYGFTPNRYGFTWNYPGQYKTGRPLTVTVRYAGTNTELFSTPRLTPACAAPANTPVVVTPAPVVVTPTPAPTPVVVTPVPTPVTPIPNTGSAPASYRGHLDVAHCDAIGGWAANISNPGQPLSVDIYIDGQKATTVLAENERRDVAAAYGFTPNRYGFTWNYPGQYKTGRPLTVTVRYAGTNTELFSTPRFTPACAAPANTPVVVTPAPVVVTPTPAPTPVVVTPVPTPVTPTPNTGSAPASYRGHLDVANCNTIWGWAANISSPAQILSLDIYIDGQKATTIPATETRTDVAAAFGFAPSNRYGFSWNYPSQYKTGRPLTVTVRYAGTSTELFSTPRTTQGCTANARTNGGLENPEFLTTEFLPVLVYPNPATTELMVKNLPFAVSEYRFQWVDLLGRQTELFPLQTGETNLARFYIGDQVRGVYILKLLRDGKQPLAVTVLKN